MTNFLNLHVLFTTNAANPNRDDTGSPKQCTFGGETRSRISSQSMTRAKRFAFETEIGGDQISFRAKSGLTDRALDYALDLAQRTGTVISDEDRATLRERLKEEIDRFVKKSDKKVSKGAKKTAKVDDGLEEEASTPQDDGKKETLIWLAEPELRKAAETALSTLVDSSVAIEFLDKSQRSLSLSIAAFGRMFAARPDLQNEAAIQRSHAFTTHIADIDPDYFTAVNDLPEDAEGRGAGHLGIALLTGGVYYWHCTVDRDQLWRSWISPQDRNTAAAHLKQLFEALLTALPSGKQNTSAHKTLPDAVLAVEARQPVALHQAFEQPVNADRRSGFRDPSLEQLVLTHQRLTRFMPSTFGAHHLATVLDSEHETDPSLESLINACVAWALAGRREG